MAIVNESDVVVVGAGIGGALAAFQLASKGLRVAVVDKGRWLNSEQTQTVYETESFKNRDEVPCESIEIRNGRKKTVNQLPSVVGGLARFYAAVSLRMREQEFEKWPFDYDDIEPYYARGEELLGVSGTTGADPLEPPRTAPYPNALPEMSELSRKLSQGAVELGLNPFQHPFAIRFEDGCKRCNYCNQVPCPYSYKWSPDYFLRSHEDLPIQVFDTTRVDRLHWNVTGSDRRIESVEGRDAEGKLVSFRADKYILAGGAIFTPSLMIQSGLGEVNPLIGTHLMTHCLGLVLGIFPFKISAEDDFHKWWSVSDFYFDPEGNVRGLIQQDHLTTRRSIFSRVPRIFHPLAEKFYYNTCQLLVMAEDEGRPENRIEVTSSGFGKKLTVQQTFSQRDNEKRAFLESRAKEIMKKAGARFTVGLRGQSVYHACGTCRMGEVPSESVTDRQGKVWGMENLYVADGSLMTTSSGVNPSLTIAANALRVADLI